MLCSISDGICKRTGGGYALRVTCYISTDRSPRAGQCLDGCPVVHSFCRTGERREAGARLKRLIFLGARLLAFATSSSMPMAKNNRLCPFRCSLQDQTANLEPGIYPSCNNASHLGGHTSTLWKVRRVACMCVMGYRRCSASQAILEPCSAGPLCRHIAELAH